MRVKIMVCIINFILKIVLYELLIKYEYINTYGRHSSAHVNFINSLFRINLAMLAKFAIHYCLKAT